MSNPQPGMLRRTVTLLEMRERPSRPRLLRPPAQKLALLRAEQPTVSFYRYLYDNVGENWLWADRRRMSAPDLAAAIQAPGVEIYVLYKAGVPAGYAELDRRPGTNVKLQYLGLMPEFIGRGLGSFLLDAAVDAAWAGGASALSLRTDSFDHPRAFVIYQRAGFVPVGQHVEDVPDPRREGLIPPTAAPHIPLAGD